MNPTIKYLEPSNPISGNAGDILGTILNPFGIGTGKRKAAKAEEERVTMELAAELEIKKKNAGIISDNELASQESGSNVQTYIILGVVLVLVVGLAVYFKFRK